jgi:hypothetical protein
MLVWIGSFKPTYNVYDGVCWICSSNLLQGSDILHVGTTSIDER